MATQKEMLQTLIQMVSDQNDRIAQLESAAAQPAHKNQAAKKEESKSDLDTLCEKYGLNKLITERSIQKFHRWNKQNGMKSGEMSLHVLSTKNGRCFTKFFRSSTKPTNSVAVIARSV